jgi:UDP-GlcNAc:undecaprenyl-phosphate GlcNAc-1-phosphate transferase
MYVLSLLAFTPFVLALLFTPICRNIFQSRGWVDRQDSRKTHSIAVPRVGGIPIALAYVAALALLLAAPGSTGAAALSELPAVLKFLPSAALVFAIGLLDDLIGLNAFQKLLGQLAASSLAVWAGVQIHGIGGQALPAWVGIPITLFWLIACSNAFNLIDGVDGLAVGAGLFATVTTLTAGLMQHNYQLVLVTLPLAGALLGFLRYNFNPASIFLGDCGSLLIGFLVGCFGILWSQKSATALGMTAPLLAFALPLLDTLVSMARRLLRHQPVFGPDRDHIHHKLLQRGLSPRRVALLLYAACGLCAGLSLVLSTARDRFAGLVIVVFCLAAWLGIQHLGYAEFSMARSLVVAGTYRRLINAHLALRNFREALTAACDVNQVWDAIHKTYRAFGFHEIDLRIDGNVYAERTIDGGARAWVVRISLPGSDSVTLTRRMDSETPPLMAVYVDTLSASLRRKLPELRATAPAAQTAASAAASGP